MLLVLILFFFSGRRGKGRGRTPATTRARRAHPSGSDGDFLEGDFHPAKREGGKGKGGTKPKLSFDSDEDSDIDLFQVEQRKYEMIQICLLLYFPWFSNTHSHVSVPYSDL